MSKFIIIEHNEILFQIFPKNNLITKFFLVFLLKFFGDNIRRVPGCS